MKIFETGRDIPATPEQVFAAFRDPERLARWWGPAGFTTTFTLCEFRTGGRWAFTMHAPNGANYPNESVFAEIVEPGNGALGKVVIDHIDPQFRLTICIAAATSGSRVNWTQEFAREEVAAKLAKIAIPANEQNLDRLTAEVARSN